MARGARSDPAPGSPDASGGPGTEKVCGSCGRRFAWRRKWERSWPEVRFCSEACRRRKVTTEDSALEDAFRALLGGRQGTVCPSEAARIVGGEDWRDLMEPARRAARRLVAAGEVEITQRGRVVDPSDFSGPIRVRRARAGPAGPARR